MGIIAIDPGQKGAIIFKEKNSLKVFLMPLEEKRVDFISLIQVLLKLPNSAHVFLERAAPSAMGAKHAFNYGNDFAKIEIALQILEFSVTYVESSKWSKVMHQGISKDLKPKAKSIIAVKRLYPKLINTIPKTPRSKQLHDGVVDALLIAGYGERVLK